MMRYKKLYLLLVSLVSIAVLAGCIAFLLASYDAIIRLIIAVSKKPYLENLLRTQVFTANKYLLVRYAAMAMLVVVPLCAALLLRYRQRITRFLYFVFNSIRNAYKGVKKVYRQNSIPQNITIAVLLLIIALRGLYYITEYNLQYDEMWSYNYFTAQPFYYSFVVCSNYPLYEVSTTLFKYLPFDMQVNLRLPVLIAGLLSCILLYACLKSYFNNHWAAFGGMAIFACMPVTTFYMLYARGVMYAMFFAIAGVFSMLFWLRDKARTRYLVIYAIASAAGVYSMPTNIYWCALLFVLTIVTLMKSRQYLLHFVIATAAAGLLSLLLYAPIIAGSGISFLYNAAVDTASARPSFTNLLDYHTSVATFFTGYQTLLPLFFVCALAVFIMGKRLRHYGFIISLSCCLYLLPVLIYFIQNVQLPMRSLAFTGLLIPLLYSIAVIALVKKIPQSFVFIFIIITAAGAAYISHRHDYLNWSRKLDIQARQLTYLLMQHHVATCYANSNATNLFYDYPAFEYYYKINNQPFTLTVAEQNSLRYKLFQIAGNYDCIINHINDTLPAGRYHEIYRDAERNFKVLALH